MTSHQTHDVTDIQRTQDNDICDVVTGLYCRRWYILLILSLSTTLQHAVWATWGPIAQSAKAVYGWDNSTIAVLINCGNGGVLLFLVVSGYCVSRKGLRVSMLLCTLLLAMGPGLRLIPTQPFLATILIGAGQFLNGVAGSLTTVMPTVVSETWFPSNERTTATAVGILSNTLGGAVAFLLGPALVPQPNSTNMSTLNETQGELDNVQQRIRLLSAAECGWGVLLLVLTLIYYPAKPPQPPSKSATQARFRFSEGFRTIVTNGRVWQITMVCAVPWAVFGNWLGLLDVNLHEVGITQIEAGWFGFYACVFGSLGGVCIGALMDRCHRKMKLVMLLLFTASFLTAGWITLMRDDYIYSSQGMFTVAISMIAVLENGVTPICYETTCELAYPVPEEIVGTFIGLTINFVAVIFLMIQIIPGVGTSWMNWCLVSIFGASILLLIPFKTQYNRIDVDVDVDVCRETTDLLNGREVTC